MASLTNANQSPRRGRLFERVSIWAIWSSILLILFRLVGVLAVRSAMAGVAIGLSRDADLAARMRQTVGRMWVEVLGSSVGWAMNVIFGTAVAVVLVLRATRLKSPLVSSIALGVGLMVLIYGFEALRSTMRNAFVWRADWVFWMAVDLLLTTVAIFVAIRTGPRIE